MARTPLSPRSDDILENEAGRELAAFLRAVEETQGSESVEKAGAIWIDILSSRPQSDFCSESSFRSISVEAAGSLHSWLGERSPKTPEYEAASIGQAKSRRIHLVARLAERAMGTEYPSAPVPFLEGNRSRMSAAGGLELVR